MSAITDIYDALIVRIETLLPTYKRLPNPYKIEENPELYLRQAYGLAIGPGENSNRQIGCKLSIRRTFTISICARYNATELSATGKATTEKSIIEALAIIVKDFETNTTLTTDSHIVQFESDSGINYVQTESDRFMYTDAIFPIEYFESLI